MVKLSQCLADLGITDAATFDNCDNVEDEIKVIKKIYFKLVLIQHPVSKQTTLAIALLSIKFLFSK